MLGGLRLFIRGGRAESFKYIGASCFKNRRNQETFPSFLHRRCSYAGVEIALVNSGWLILVRCGGPGD